MLCYFLLWTVLYCELTFGAIGQQTAEEALEYVYQINPDTCNVGTADQLSLQFDVTAWNHYTDPAVRTANLLSKIIATNNGTLDSLTDEMFFLLVRNNVNDVRGDTIIFGSGIAVQPGLYSKYRMFCAYAYKKNGTIYSHDIAVNYNYIDINTIWLDHIKDRDFNDVKVVTDKIKYREGDHHLPEIEVSYPIAQVSDGQWTNPYFDCGGGDVWMVTYTAPLLWVKNGSTLFRGIASVDIELTRIDINQCDNTGGESGPGSSGLDVFRGTHKCQPTTVCVSLQGYGFVTGMYRCECQKGYYFPRDEGDAYTGVEIESHIRQFGLIEPGMFQCKACAAGCETCIDSSPCLHYIDKALHISLLILASITTLGLVGIAVATYITREKKRVSLQGYGFVTGMYRCECQKGYYFPRDEGDAYTGVEIESHIRQFGLIEPGMFQCKACAAGCETCIDRSPCLHYIDKALHISLLILASITTLGLVGIAVATYITREKKVIKSANPAFLGLLCLGGILLCLQFFTTYFETTVTVCIIQIWPERIGFCLLYGSLVLKTWRISMIFTIGVRKRVHLPDKVLYQRLGILLVLTIAILAAWTTSNPPEIQSLRTSEDLLFYTCRYGPWEYAALAAEILLLLYGVYLGFTIRKVPVQFNDKYVSYAIYNAIILGIFMSLVSRLFVVVIGPDIALVLEFVQMQVYSSVTLLIIFIPKFLALRKGEDTNDVNKSIQSITTINGPNGRFLRNVPSNPNFPYSFLDVADKATQTTWDYNSITLSPRTEDNRHSSFD